MDQEKNIVDTKFNYLIIIFFVVILISVFLIYQRSFITKDFVIEQEESVEGAI